MSRDRIPSATDSRVLVTGATGFVGSHLVARLRREGIRVRALVLPQDPHLPRIADPEVDCIEGDVADGRLMRQLAGEAELVYHLAGLVTDWAPDREYERVHVLGTQNLIDAVRSNPVARLVVTIPADVFGWYTSKAWIDESHPRLPWREPYPDSKIEADRRIRQAVRDEGLRAVVLYPCWLYGPGDERMILPLVRAIRSGMMLFWNREAQIWPTAIDNLVDLLCLVGRHPAAVGREYLVHDGEGMTWMEFCGRFAEGMGLRRPGRSIPMPVALAAARGMEWLWRLGRFANRPPLTSYTVRALGNRAHYAIDRANREFGWQPRTTVQEGIRATLRWLYTVDPGLFHQPPD